MNAPYSIFERAKYKREFIKKFGKERFESDHNSVPYSYTDSAGKNQVGVSAPVMPMDVAFWLRDEMQWPVGIYLNVVKKQSSDIGSNISFNAAQVKATTENVIDDVQDGAKKTIRTVAILGGIVLLIVYKKPIMGVFNQAGKAAK